MYNTDMSKEFKQYGMVLLIAITMLAWGIFFHYYPIEKLVSSIGIQNVYLATLLLTVVGGFSSITGPSLYMGLIDLSKSGGNNLMLATISGLGLFISDSFFFFIFSQIRHVLSRTSNKWERIIRRSWKIVYKTPQWIMCLIIFIWCALAPLPNDILLLFLAFGSYSYRKFSSFLFLGDLVFAFILIYISSHF